MNTNLGMDMLREAMKRGIASGSPNKTEKEQDLSNFVTSLYELLVKYEKVLGAEIVFKAIATYVGMALKMLSPHPLLTQILALSLTQIIMETASEKDEQK